MIVKGNVHTSEGPVPIENLKEGDLLIDRAHRARKLVSVEIEEVSTTLRFKKNENLLLSADTVLRSAAGKKTLGNGEKVIFLLPSGKAVSDIAVVGRKNTTGFILNIEDGDNVYVDGYNVEV